MAENNTNRLVMVLAGAVVVLLIAFVAVVMMNTGKVTPAASNPTQPSAAASATSNPGVAPSTATEFDPATATKVPAGTAPKDYVSSYYQAILDKKWDAAFKMQPAASQQGTVADFQSTQTMYGMQSFEIKSSPAGSTDATVVVQQDLGANGEWNATWTFVKSGSDWLVKARRVGMGAAE
jgi:hypothetical protein